MTRILAIIFFAAALGTVALNALRLACNQTTNRDPVVSYDERTVHIAAQELSRRGWARLASGAGSRAVKYRQLFAEALGLEEGEVAVLAVLMLRGAQTPGELKQRCERLHAFATLDEVHDVLTGLRERELVVSLGRRPGQKEERFAHLLGDEVGADEPVVAPTGRPDDAPTPASSSVASTRMGDGDLRARVEALEAELAELRAALQALQDALGPL